MSDAGQTHYVGDGCEPDGHRDDPLAAGKMNAASRHARLRAHLAAGHLEGDDYDTVTELLDAYRGNLRGRGQEIVRLTSERDALRELLVSAEGYAISHGAELPFVALFADDAPQVEVIERAGCYPKNARREHPGPLALNPPPVDQEPSDER